MEKNIVRKLKRYSINNVKKGGGDVLTLRRTQEELLKTLLTLNNTKLPEQDRFKQNLQNISKELERLDSLLKIDTIEKVVEDEPIYNKLSNFDKFLNGIPNTELNFEHLKMNAPVAPPLTLNINSLLNLDKVIDGLTKIIDFKPRDEKVSITPISNLSVDDKNIVFNPRIEKISVDNILKTPINNEKIEFTPRNEQVLIKQLLRTNIDSGSYNLEDYKKEMDTVKLFISDNKDKIEEIIRKVDLELDQYIDITKMLSTKILSYKKEFDKGKILEAISNITAINVLSTEIIEIDGLEETLEPIIPKIYEKDTKLTLNKKYYYLESLNVDKDKIIFDDDNFIDNLIDKSQRLPIQLTGGSNKFLHFLYLRGGAYLEDFIGVSKKYEDIINKRKRVIGQFTETINEYNLLFIQYFNFKFFLLKNIEKFFQTKRKIYHYLSYASIQKYLRILTHLNKVISDPDKIFNEMIALINNIHSKMYFKHFLIIKILFNLFDGINKKWETEKWDKTFMIDLFNYEIEQLSQVNLCMYLLIFNFYYTTLDKYEQTFNF